MLPAQQRLRKNADFRTVYRLGRSYVHALAVLYVFQRTGEAAAACPHRRIGFVVSKKQGGAVVRNRIKRRLREAVRLCLPDLRDGPYDLILVGRGRLQSAQWAEAQTVVLELMRRARLIGN